MNKIIFDFSLSFLLLIFFTPVLLVISLIIFYSSGLPIIHWSNRVGKNNFIFKMPKFRTMTLNTPIVATHLLRDSKLYLTPEGYFLRKFSLDELPQLWSVLIGKMSFVGPRPALYNQYDLIKLRSENGISSLKPGITGWAQVNGRDNLSISQKLEYDIYYLKNKNFIFDIIIMLITIFKLPSAKGVIH